MQRDSSRQRGASRSPSHNRKGAQAESSIYLPFRYGGMVPYCQILAIDQLERRFVGPIERLFRQADIQLHIYQMPQSSVGPQDIKRLIMEGVQAVIFLKKHHQESGMVTLQVFDPETKVGDEKVDYDEYQLLEPRDAVEIVRRHKDLRKKALEARESPETKDAREEQPHPRRVRSPEPPKTPTRKPSDAQGNQVSSMPPPPPVPPVPPAIPVAPQYPAPPPAAPPMAPPALPLPPSSPAMQPVAQVQAGGLNPALLSMLAGVQTGATNAMNSGTNLLQLLSLMQSIPPQLLQQFTQAGMMNMMPQGNANLAVSLPGFSQAQAQLTSQGILTTTPTSFAPMHSSPMPHPLTPAASLPTSTGGYNTQVLPQPLAPQQAPQTTQQHQHQHQHQQPQVQQVQQAQQVQQQQQVPPPTHQQTTRPSEGKEPEPPVAQSPSQNNQSSSRVADILKQLAQLQKQGPAQRYMQLLRSVTSIRRSVWNGKVYLSPLRPQARFYTESANQSQQNSRQALHRAQMRYLMCFIVGWTGSEFAHTLYKRYQADEKDEVPVDETSGAESDTK
ncbi:hypothetical protein DFQ26_007785 [Actinomortierella ambigua]|nr:hypothetical protein DFQ26_007785 [Actinomortierella ambigua]